jgi:hypothetical protein
LLLGLPGCLGSIDAVFIPWDRVPFYLKNACNGDKGVGLLYEVVVTHEKLILLVSGPFHATINDKISVKYSEFVNAMKEGVIASDVKYKLRTGLGVEDFIELCNTYLVTDGGYLAWEQLICGYSYDTNPLK